MGAPVETRSIIADDDAERAIICSALVKQAALFRAVERMVPDDFYFQGNRVVFKAIAAMTRKGAALSLPAVVSFLTEHGALEKAGGREGLVEYYREFYVYDIDQVIDTVIDLAKRRRAQALGEDLMRRMAGAVEDVDELLAEYDEKLLEIRMDRSSTVKSMRSLCSVNIDDLRDTVPVHRTQYSDLNYLIKGFRAGRYYMLAARTSKGKSALALNLAVHVARTEPVLYVSLEMTADELRDRAVGVLAGVDTQRIESGTLSDGERERAVEALALGRELALDIVDDRRYCHEICGLAKRRHQEKRLGLVVVDYIQKVKLSGSKNLQRYQQLGEISGDFQALAKSLRLPLLCCAQLSRSADNREPELSDLRESGDLEQDPDLVMFLHPKDERGQVTSVGQLVDLLVKKQRGGPLGTVELWFERPYTRFSSFSNR